MEIYIKPEPLDEDNGTTLVCKTPDGNIHEVYPLTELEEGVDGWIKVQAIRKKIEGRKNEILIQI